MVPKLFYFSTFRKYAPPATNISVDWSPLAYLSILYISAEYGSDANEMGYPRMLQKQEKVLKF